jgi:hypothetical protein
MKEVHRMFKKLFIFISCLSLFYFPATAVGTESVHIVKYDTDGVTIIGEKTITYQEMEASLPVYGDGTTRYYMQGPTFQPQDLWNPEETLSLKDKGALKGTAFKDLCALVGGAGDGDMIRVEADDGYSWTFHHEAPYIASAPMVLCWYRDGDYVPAWSSGLQMVFFDQTANGDGKHVFGNRDMREYLHEDSWRFFQEYPSSNGLSVKMVAKIVIFHPWNLQLDGRVGYTMSQSEFESGVEHHGAVTWMDGDDTWSGLPLWMLAARVDDEVMHGPGSFNEELALEGYTITLHALDGYSWTFDSADVEGNDSMIIANRFNGEPLPGERFPLRLVGPGLPGREKVSQVVRIELSGFPEEPEFIRGDVNGDGVINIADPIRLLSYLFRIPEPPGCQDAADSNNDGDLDIVDAIGILGYLFAAEPPLPAPFPGCGPDEDEVEDTLDKCLYDAGVCPEVDPM